MAGAMPRNRSRPTDILHLTDDVVAIADALGHREFAVVGHDWGAPVAWHTALLHEDRVRAVAGLAVPYTRFETPQVLTRQEFWGDRFWYTVYFQTPGRAEAELDADLRRSLRLTYFAASGDFSGSLVDLKKPSSAGFLDGIPEPTSELSWLSPSDLDYYASQFARNGFRGPAQLVQESGTQRRDHADAPRKNGFPAGVFSRRRA